MSESRFRSSVGTGFTLVELVVTLVIVGALAAVSAPVFFSANDFKERAFYREALATVRYAQKRALATGCNVQVAFGAGAIALTEAAAVGNCTAGPYSQAVPDPSGNAAGFQRPYPAGMAVSSSSSPFTFAPSGAASSLVTVTIGGQTFTVDPMTGYAHP